MAELNGGSLSAEHLCVMVHGLWGKPDHLRTVAKTLRAQFPEDKLHLLVAKSNSGYFTYDGIETGGERVCAEIEEVLATKVKEGGQIKRISVIGYSLGGLVARYAVGLLHAKGILGKLECMNFTAFASPFLGARSPLKGIPNILFNVFGAHTLSVSGQQLFGIDSFRDTGRPLLAVLADPDSIFIAGLARFRRRTLYANVINDRTAVYYTTSISTTDPYAAIMAKGGEIDDLPLRYVPGYEHNVIANGGPVDPDEYGDAGTATSPIPRKLRGWKAAEVVLTNPTSAEAKAVLMDMAPIAAIVTLLPLGVVLYMANSAYQTIQSKRRLLMHVTGQAGVDVHQYRVPLWIDNLSETAEEAYEHINNAHEQEFLTEEEEEGVVQDEDEDEDDSNDDSTTKLLKNGDGKTSRLRKPRQPSTSSSHRHHPPYLALTKEQFAMAEALNSLGWRKYPIWFHKVRHSHAAMIVRWETPRFQEGYTVLRHYVNEEFLI